MKSCFFTKKRISKHLESRQIPEGSQTVPKKKSLWWKGKECLREKKKKNLFNLVSYEGCSKSNASYFITMAHNIRGRCWWYGTRGWIFPSVFCYFLLPCDRWQQRGTQTKWHLTWKCLWSKGVELNSAMQKKKMTSIGIQWYSPNVYQDQTVDVRTVRQWTVRFSSDNSSMKDKPHSRWPCTAVTP